MSAGRIYSPLAVFLILLAVFEVCLRLPYALMVAFDPTYGHYMQIHFFSVFPPGEVIWTGLLVIGLTMASVLFVSLIDGISYPNRKMARGLPRIPASLHPVALVFFGAAIVAVLQLGPDALTEELSSKRSELEERGTVYFFVKLGNFLHVIGFLYFIRIQQCGGRWADRIGFSVSLLLLFVLSVVFSQRAVLLALALEIVYLQLAFGTFRMGRTLRICGAIACVVVLISIMRPGIEFESWTDAAVFGLEKVLQSRYMLDFLKIGTVMLWDAQSSWLGPISLAFLFEPLIPDDVIFYKEVGPLIARDVFFYHSKTGITPGALLEAILSFGAIGGIAFFALLYHLFLRAERAFLTRPKPGLAWTLALLIIISKFTLLVNSSLGAFAFQVCVELVLLAVTLAAILGLAELAPRRQVREYST